MILMIQNSKYYRMFSLATLLILTFTVLNSCVKSRDGRTDFGALQPVVLIPEGGLNAFSSQYLLFPVTDITDTAFFYVNYAATNVAATDKAITLAIDSAALSSYNAANPTQYEMFPDSIYRFTSKEIIIKKGNNYSDMIPLTLFSSKIDPTKNYLLPISIKAVPSGSTISGNFGTIYYHFIGNPIAGSYTQQWISYDNAAGTGTPDFNTTSTATFAKLGPTSISVASGTGTVYDLNFTNNNGLLSDFQLSIDTTTLGTFKITNGPNIKLADPKAGKYEFNFTFKDATGSSKNITDRFTK